MVSSRRYRSPCFGLADFGVKRAFCYGALSLQLKRLRVVRARLIENPAQKFMRVSLFSSLQPRRARLLEPADHRRERVLLHLACFSLNIFGVP